MPRRRTWTDDDLRGAVRTSRTLAEVARRLRLSHGGAAYVTVRSRMEQLGLVLQPDVTDRQQVEGDGRSWTDDELRAAVARAMSLNEVFTQLGLSVGGSQWLVVRSLILKRGWSTAHWTTPLTGGVAGAGPTRAEAFREALATCDLSEVVQTCSSRAEVIRELGFTPTSTTYRLLRGAMSDLGLAGEHFRASHEAMRGARRPRYRVPLEQVLVEGSTYRSMSVLKRRLVDNGLLEPRCAICHLDTWRGKPIALHLDHVNGIRDYNRLGNLRLLCPNCHSQTDTFAGRNKGRYSGTRLPGQDPPCGSLDDPPT